MSDQDHDGLLTETLARHFDRARIDGNDVDLSVAGLSVTCRVNK